MNRIVFVLFLVMLLPSPTFAEITKKVVEKYPDVSSGAKTLPG